MRFSPISSIAYPRSNIAKWQGHCVIKQAWQKTMAMARMDDLQDWSDQYRFRYKVNHWLSLKMLGRDCFKMVAWV